MMTEIFIPLWLAEKICGIYGSLENYSLAQWGGYYEFVAGYPGEIEDDPAPHLGDGTWPTKQ